MKAALQGLTQSQRNVAVCYEHGIGTDKDQGKALEWQNKAKQNSF